MIFHLGSRVADLVDGQLPTAQADRAWEHVHSCPTCRAAVEREGWIKRELAVLSFSAPAAPQLRVSPVADPWGAMPLPARPRRLAGLAAIGAGSLGAAMFGVLVLGGVPDSTSDRRLPVTNLEQPVSPTTRAPSTTDKTDGAAPLEAAWVRMGL